MNNESRFRMLEAAGPARYKELAARASRAAARRLDLYRHLSSWKTGVVPSAVEPASSSAPAPADALVPAGGAK